MLALLRPHSARRARRTRRNDIAFGQILQCSAHVSFEQKSAAPTSGPVEATCCEAMKSLLLLALVVSLRRMVVSCFGFISCLSRLLLCTHMIVAAVLLRGSPMSLRSLLMMFGSLFVHILRHNISLLF
jgi:hypothetical protein